MTLPRWFGCVALACVVSFAGWVFAQDKASKTKKAPPKTAGAGSVAMTSQWPHFRGPSAMGMSDQKLPTEWSGDQNIKWKIDLPGAGASSPIVAKDRIYLTCYSGYFVPGQEGGSLDDLKRHLLAINPKDGAILWDKPLPAKLPEEAKIRDHGYAASTPAADDKHVYVFYGKTGVFAFDHTGKQVWQADVGETTSGWGSAASPVLYKDLVIINASVESESVVALDRATGKEKWRQTGIKESWNTPVVIKAKSGREELIVPIGGKVLAFDPATGNPLWSCNTDIGWYMVPSIVAHDGIVYCLGGRSGITALAVRAGGSGDVTAENRLWTSQKGSNVSSPVFHDGHLYWMNDSQGIAYCAVAETGKIVYEKRLERADQIYSSPLLANGNIYYVTRWGRTFVLAAKPSFEQVAVNDLRDGSIFDGSPAVLGNQLLVRSNKALYCIGK